MFGDYWVDFDTLRGATRDGVVQLSQKEIAVMRLFLARPNQVVTRRELLAEVWQLPHHPNTRVVDNVIVALRQAFEETRCGRGTSSACAASATASCPEPGSS